MRTAIIIIILLATVLPSLSQYKKIIHVVVGRAGYLTPRTGYHADRFEWYKRVLPGLSQRHISSSREVDFDPIKYEDEGYYCCYIYRGSRLMEKYCFKLVVIPPKEPRRRKHRNMEATDEAVDRPTGKSLIPNKEMFVTFIQDKDKEVHS